MSPFRLVYLALLTALSLSLFVLEGMFPLPFLAPGAKLGLANIVTVFALYTLSAPDVLLVLCLRIGLASFFGGGPTVFLYSLAGGLLSLVAMRGLSRVVIGHGHPDEPRRMCTSTKAKQPLFSLPAVSAAGGFFHHLGQLFAAIAMTGTPSLLSYLAILGPIGLATGFATGCVVVGVRKRLRGAAASILSQARQLK